MKKREFIRKISLLSASAAIMPPLHYEANNENNQDVSNVKLRDKFFGCIAGCHTGSAMGAPLEGSSYERIEKEYGTLDKLLPHHHYGSSNDWMRELG